MLNSLLKDSAIYGGADLLSKILAFIAFPIIAAVLSPLAFGTIELLTATAAIAGLIIKCGLSNSLQRFYWDRETDDNLRPVLVSSGLGVMVVFGTLVLIMGCISVLVFIPEIQQLGLPMTWIAIISTLVLLVFTEWSVYLQDVTRLHFAPWKFVSLALTTKVLGLGLGVVAVVWLGWGVDGLLAVQAIAAIITFPLALWLVRKDLTVQIDLAWVKELTRFGYPFIFAGLAYWIFGYIDRWMLAGMTSVDEVGLYSVSFRFASVVMLLSAAFGQAWSPYSIKLRTDFPDSYRTVYAQVLLLLLFVMLIAGGGIALFSGELIGMIMPDAYSASAVPLAILCFGIVLQATQQITAVGISLEKKTFLFARLAWITAAINFILNLILIPEYGAIGAAWATTISYLVLTACYIFYTQKLHPIPIRWDKLFIMLFLASGVLFISIKYNATVISLPQVLFKLLIAALCIGAVWRLLPIGELFPRADKISEQNK